MRDQFVSENGDMNRQKTKSKARKRGAASHEINESHQTSGILKCCTCNNFFQDIINFIYHISYQHKKQNCEYIFNALAGRTPFNSNAATIKSQNIDNSIHADVSNEKTQLLNRFPAKIWFTNMICKTCYQTFSTKKTFTFHMKTAHGPINLVKWHFCPFCKNKFINTSGVERHLLKVHKKTEEEVRQLRPHIQIKELPQQFQQQAVTPALAMVPTSLPRHWSQQRTTAAASAMVPTSLPRHRSKRRTTVGASTMVPISLPQQQSQRQTTTTASAMVPTSLPRHRSQQRTTAGASAMVPTSLPRHWSQRRTTAGASAMVLTSLPQQQSQRQTTTTASAMVPISLPRHRSKRRTTAGASAMVPTSLPQQQSQRQTTATASAMVPTSLPRQRSQRRTTTASAMYFP